MSDAQMPVTNQTAQPSAAPQQNSGLEAAPATASRLTLGVVSIVLAVISAVLFHVGLTVMYLPSTQPMMAAYALGGFLFGVVVVATGLAVALTGMIRRRLNPAFVAVALVLNFASLGSAVLRWVYFTPY